MADSWVVVFEDPTTGEPRSLKSTRPLRQDEIVGAARERWGQDAKILHRDPYPAPSGLQDALKPRGTGGVPAQYGPTPPPEEIQRQSRGLMGMLAGLVPAIAGPRLGAAALSQTPRLGRLLGGTMGGAAAGATSNVVGGGKFEDIPSDMGYGAAYGFGGAGATAAKGMTSRHTRGAEHRVGEEMAGQLEGVAGSQVPPMKGLKTGGHMADWAGRREGQRGLSQMFENAKQSVLGYLPSEASLHIPSLNPTAPMTFEEALRELSTKGRSFTQQANVKGVQAGRTTYMQARDEMERELVRRGVPRDVVDDFFTMREQYAMGKGYQGLLEKGTTSRELDPGKLQALLANPKVMKRLEAQFGESRDPQALNRVLDVILRGAKDPRTGTYAIGKGDIPPAESLSQAIRAYMIPVGGELKMRAGMAVPHGSLFTKYLAAPGRLPLEAKPKTMDIMATLAQLAREGMTGPVAPDR